MQPELGSLSQLEPEAWQPWTKTFCISQECGDLTVAFLYWLGFMLSRREGALGLQFCVCAFRTAWSRTSVFQNPAPLQASPSTTVAWNYGSGQCYVGKVEIRQSWRSQVTKKPGGWSIRTKEGLEMKPWFQSCFPQLVEGLH